MQVGTRALERDRPAVDERLQAAQRVLARAEAAAGLRTALPAVAASVARPTGEVVTAPATVAAVDDRLLPVPEALVPLVPLGGLRRGSAVHVKGSTSLLLGLAAAACGDGAWCVVVGMPDLGLAAAAEHGLPLDRMALVPAPGADSVAVLGAAIDGFDVVVLGDVPHLVDRDRRRLASRLRQRAAVLLTTSTWPGVELTLAVTGTRWTGLGQGHGSLTGRDVVIRVGGRGAAGGRGVQGTVHSPDGVRLVLSAPARTAPAGPASVDVRADALPVRLAG